MLLLPSLGCTGKIEMEFISFSTKPQIHTHNVIKVFSLFLLFCIIVAVIGGKHFPQIKCLCNRKMKQFSLCGNMKIVDILRFIEKIKMVSGKWKTNQWFFC